MNGASSMVNNQYNLRNIYPPFIRRSSAVGGFVWRNGGRDMNYQLQATQTPYPAQLVNQSKITNYAKRTQSPKKSSERNLFNNCGL